MLISVQKLKCNAYYRFLNENYNLHKNEFYIFESREIKKISLLHL